MSSLGGTARNLGPASSGEHQGEGGPVPQSGRQAPQCARARFGPLQAVARVGLDQLHPDEQAVEIGEAGDGGATVVADGGLPERQGEWTHVNTPGLVTWSRDLPIEPKKCCSVLW